MHTRFIGIMAIAGFLWLGLAPVAAADHAWGNYHWARTTNPLTLKLGDNVSSSWDKYLSLASSDWSKSLMLDTSIVSGNTTATRCAPTSGAVEVCNAKYGSSGWLGIAQIWVSGGHIAAGTVKLNDSYFNSTQYNKGSWKQFVMCQEVGHIFGLDHQDETMNNSNLGSCMDYTNSPWTNSGLGNNLRADLHDFNVLKSIYGHFDSTNTSQSSVSQSAAAEADARETRSLGRALRQDARGRDSQFVRENARGEKVFTFIIWADEEQEQELN